MIDNWEAWKDRIDGRPTRGMVQGAARPAGSGSASSWSSAAAGARQRPRRWPAGSASRASTCPRHSSREPACAFPRRITSTPTSRRSSVEADSARRRRIVLHAQPRAPRAARAASSRASTGGSGRAACSSRRWARATCPAGRESSSGRRASSPVIRPRRTVAFSTRRISTLVRDELVTIREPDGDATFHWVLARSMSCAFVARPLRRAARGSACRRLPFAGFERAPRPGDLFLRHDVDLSLDAALRMAELEAEAGATATYFLMTESVFYNLASKEGDRGARAAAGARPPRRAARGLPANATLDERFDPVVAWHNPDPEYMTRADRRRGERDAGALVRPARLPLGLEPALALRLPPRGAARGSVPLAPAPDAPRDLGLSGRHDGRDDARDARRRARAAPRRSWPRTGSTWREPPTRHRPRLRLRRAGHRRAAPRRCARTASARCASSARTCPSARSAATSATRSTSSRPARTPASRTRCSTSSSARAWTSSCRSRRSTSKASRRTASASRCRCSSPRPDTIHRSNDKAETYAFLHRLGAPGARRSAA